MFVSSGTKSVPDTITAMKMALTKTIIDAISIEIRFTGVRFL